MKSGLSVELSSQVLQYIKYAMMDAFAKADEQNEKRSRTTDHVRWRSDRNTWVAERIGEDNKRIYKSFKPHNPDCEAARQQARQLALQWVHNGDSEAVVDE